MSSRSRHRDLGQLWCTATLHNCSVDVVDAQVRRWKPIFYDGVLTHGYHTVHYARVGLGSRQEQTVDTGVAQDGFVELWAHESGYVRKMFRLGRWWLLLAYSRLGECPR